MCGDNIRSRRLERCKRETEAGLRCSEAEERRSVNGVKSASWETVSTSIDTYIETTKDLESFYLTKGHADSRYVAKVRKRSVLDIAANAAVQAAREVFFKANPNEKKDIPVVVAFGDGSFGTQRGSQGGSVYRDFALALRRVHQKSARPVETSTAQTSVDDVAELVIPEVKVRRECRVMTFRRYKDKVTCKISSSEEETVSTVQSVIFYEVNRLAVLNLKDSSTLTSRTVHVVVPKPESSKMRCVLESWTCDSFSFRFVRNEVVMRKTLVFYVPELFTYVFDIWCTAPS